VIPGAIVVSEVKMCRELEGTETALTTPGDSHTECGPVGREPSPHECQATAIGADAGIGRPMRSRRPTG